MLGRGLSSGRGEQRSGSCGSETPPPPSCVLGRCIGSTGPSAAREQLSFLVVNAGNERRKWTWGISSLYGKSLNLCATLAGGSLKAVRAAGIVTTLDCGDFEDISVPGIRKNLGCIFAIVSTISVSVLFRCWRPDRLSTRKIVSPTMMVCLRLANFFDTFHITKWNEITSYLIFQKCDVQLLAGYDDSSHFITPVKG